MKKEAGIVFGPHITEEPENEIINGIVIQAQVSLELDAETNTMMRSLKFWITPELAPDQYSYGADFNAPYECVVLEDEDSLSEAIEILDKAALFIFSQHGIDYAKLVRMDDALQIIDVPQGYDSDQALLMAGNFYIIQELAKNPDLDDEKTFQMLESYAEFLGLGDCEQSLSRKVIRFPDLLSEDFDDLDEDEKNQIIQEALPDVEVQLNDDQTLSVSFCDESHEKVNMTFPYDFEGLHSVMGTLYTIGESRGYCNINDYTTLINLWGIVEQGEPIEELIENIVTKKNLKPMHEAAIKSFMALQAQPGSFQ